MLGSRGQPIRDRRALLAIRMGTRKGKEMEHVSWLAHEYATLQALERVGVRVPQPIAFANNTILMEYAGTLRAAAPVLQSVSLARDEARELFNALIADVERMLAAGHVHADLSAFNVLYLGDGDCRIIDFPSRGCCGASSAPALFERDVRGSASTTLRHPMVRGWPVWTGLRRSAAETMVASWSLAPHQRIRERMTNSSGNLLGPVSDLCL